MLGHIKQSEPNKQSGICILDQKTVRDRDIAKSSLPVVWIGQLIVSCIKCGSVV